MRTNERRLLGTATILLALAAPGGAAAQGWIEPLPGNGASGVVRVDTDVTVRVRGRIAEVVVEEWFEHRGGGLGQGDYIYPLPGEAVFSSFSLYQGDQELRGETMNAERARAIYEEIVRRHRDPALIELVGHGAVRARVFPFQPGERRRITLRYTQVLDRAGQSLRFRYAAGGPTTAADIRAPASGGGTWTETAHGGRVPIRLTLTADPDQFGEPFSPTHTLDVERRAGQLRVRTESAVAVDLSLFLPLAGNAVGITLATHRAAAEDGYFMLTLSPAAAEREAATPRDVTAVVDVSGSMSGAKMEQTRAALHQLLGSLGPGDRFRLVAFSNRVTSSSDGWSEVTPAAIRDARRWVDDLRAEGGTNIAGALDEALRVGSPDDRLPIVVFLTDGLPTVGEEDPEGIAAAAESGRGRARIFAVGVGYDVNTYLLDRLGSAGRGSTEYVEPGEDVETALATLAAKITYPVLTDLRIADAPVRLVEIYPGELPDLFAGEELVVFGRWRGAGTGRLAVAGTRQGRDERFAVDATFPARTPGDDYIPRLWAARKLGELTRQIRLNGPDPELVQAVRETALRYGLLSEYTSYLVQEPGMVADGAGVRPHPLAMPAPPPAPQGGAGAARAMSGEAAVKASERSRARLGVASAADLAEAEAEAAEGLAMDAAGGGAGVRVVAGRTFRRAGAEWLEVGVGEGASQSVETVEIELFSDAYFAVLAALTELRPVVTELTPVTVRGRSVRIRFADEGRAAIGARELERLVTRFRGS